MPLALQLDSYGLLGKIKFFDLGVWNYNLVNLRGSALALSFLITKVVDGELLELKNVCVSLILGKFAYKNLLFQPKTFLKRFSFAK